MYEGYDDLLDEDRYGSSSLSYIMHVPKTHAQKVADWRFNWGDGASWRKEGTGTLQLGDGVNNHPFAGTKASERWKTHPIHKERAKAGRGAFDFSSLAHILSGKTHSPPPPVKSGEPGYEHYAAAQEQKVRVGHLQAQLQALGIASGATWGRQSGHFDADTERRVKAYQQRKLRPVTGKVNGPMWKALAHDVDKGIKAGTIGFASAQSLAELNPLQRAHATLRREEMQALLALTPAQLNALPLTWSLYSRQQKAARTAGPTALVQPGPALGPNHGPPVDWLAIYGPGKTPPRNQQEFEQAVEKRGLTGAPPVPRGTPGGPPATPKDNRLLMGVGAVVLIGAGWYFLGRAPTDY
jgi:peptidoglycan hydrolase-like protein with peptidoglycan-binding domain